MKTLIKKVKLRFYKNRSWEYFFTLLSLKFPDMFVAKKYSVLIQYFDLEIPWGSFSFLLEGYENAYKLKEVLNAKFFIEEQKLFLIIKSLKFEIQTSEELFILKEIFVEGVYNFNLIQDAKDYVLIDIGMNVAFASCYFVKVKQVSQVISFEPFTPTYKQALVNIGLNNLNEKIDARNYGIGGSDEVMNVPYTPEFRGQVGMQGTDYIRSKITKSVLEKIVIKDAFIPLNEISQEYSDKRFIMKIDCEGAEYDLIDKIPLEMLQRCDVIMMEWHEKGPNQIEEWLHQHGYMQFSFYPYSDRAGMLYAVKKG